MTATRYTVFVDIIPPPLSLTKGNTSQEKIQGRSRLGSWFSDLFQPFEVIRFKCHAAVFFHVKDGSIPVRIDPSRLFDEDVVQNGAVPTIAVFSKIVL